ncbi:translation initiation factor eIF3 subunit-domain-containing protein [Irpex lacteus]|nr:translation initiation factor eIF3 subunit-domain-containing protein [Irpex lacteus]
MSADSVLQEHKITVLGRNARTLVYILFLVYCIMSDWENDSDSPAETPAAPAVKKHVPVKSKWEGEDEEDNGPVSDWEDSSDEDEKPKATTTSAAAPPKKKGTLKQKLAEKAAAAAARADEDEDYDEDAVLDPREKARRDKERELNADLNNAADLLGAAALGGTSSKELDSLISAQPRTKDDFIKLSNDIITYIIKRHQDKPLYATFVEHHVRELAQPLRDVEVRKAASSLTTLANEKQKEQRDKSSGKKKTKGAAKPGLGAAKVASKLDTSVYDEALDDFGSRADDFIRWALLNWEPRYTGNSFTLSIPPQAVVEVAPDDINGCSELALRRWAQSAAPASDVPMRKLSQPSQLVTSAAEVANRCLWNE